MCKFSKRIWLSIIITVAFFIAGHLGLYIEEWNSNLFAGTAVFGVSFVSIIASILKLWSDIIS